MRHFVNGLAVAAGGLALQACASTQSVASLTGGLIGVGEPLRVEQMLAVAPTPAGSTSSEGGDGGAHDRGPGRAAGTPATHSDAEVGAEDVSTVPTVARRRGTDGWEIGGTMYGWVPAFDGSAVIGGQPMAVDSTISDTWDTATEDLETGVVGHVEARNGDFSVFGDVMYLKFDFPTDLASASIDAEPSLGFAEIGGTYVLDRISYAGDHEYQKNAGARELGARFDVLAGARYTDIEVDIKLDVDATGPAGQREFQAAKSGDREKNWWDAFIGARMDADLTETTSLLVRYDVGGFDIGSGSDRTWNLITMLEHDFTETVTGFVGWRWLDIDYDSGRGANRFEFDVRLAGPMAGVTIWF